METKTQAQTQQQTQSPPTETHGKTTKDNDNKQQRQTQQKEILSHKGRYLEQNLSFFVFDDYSSHVSFVKQLFHLFDEIV